MVSTCQDFVRKVRILGKMGPNLPKSGVFSHFLEFESLDFSDFAYYDRQAWYLAGTGGSVAEKKFPVQIWAILGPKYRFFGILSETTIEISSILHQSVEDDGAEQSQKALENLYSSSGDIWGHIIFLVAGHAWACRPRKKNFSQSFKMVQFAKLTG